MMMSKEAGVAMKSQKVWIICCCTLVQGFRSNMPGRAHDMLEDNLWHL
jgi:hypothetical protein